MQNRKQSRIKKNHRHRVDGLFNIDLDCICIQKVLMNLFLIFWALKGVYNGVG